MSKFAKLQKTHMIDLTNKNIDEINILVQKYSPVFETFETIKPETQRCLAYIIDIAYNYLQEKYNDLNSDWKTWTIVVLKNRINKINCDEDILKIIDDFIDYYNTNYQEYCENIISANEFDKNNGFISKYLKDKIGG